MRKSRLNKRRDAQKNQSTEAEVNPYASELEVPAKTKLYTKIFVGALILITAAVFFSTDMLNKQNDKSLLARIVEEDTSDYFAAVFFYKQILGIDEAEIEVHQKLIEALKASCENGHDIHCGAVGKAERRLKFVENE